LATLDALCIVTERHWRGRQRPTSVARQPSASTDVLGAPCGERFVSLWYDGHRVPRRGIPAGQNPMKDRLIKKFEDEIASLDRELKLELPREIKRARELGDLRENAEYAAAKERQRLVEARISMLKKRVAEIALINVDRIPSDRAGFGSTVHVVESNGERLVFQLVMPEDADASKGLISTTSPLGRAFLNKEPGDSVKVTTPGGQREFEIVKLMTIHDDSNA
jgi:transcription elongation factor GreA